MSTVGDENSLIFSRLATYMNERPDFIDSAMISELERLYGVCTEEAFSLLLCAALGFDTSFESDRLLWERYAPHMLHRLDEAYFSADPFAAAVGAVAGGRKGVWELVHSVLPAYSLVACGDPVTLPDGRVIPQVGYFDTDYRYIAVLEQGREWMTMLPNESITQRVPIAAARGRVLTYGLGLGYYAFMTSRRAEVADVTVVERDKNVISLFESLILPCFSHPEKLHIVCADAFEYAEHSAPQGGFDCVFADIWHDPSDGVAAYKRFRQYEPLFPAGTRFDYWIEDTIKLYL